MEAWQSFNSRSIYPVTNSAQEQAIKQTKYISTFTKITAINQQTVESRQLTMEKTTQLSARSKFCQMLLLGVLAKTSQKEKFFMNKYYCRYYLFLMLLESVLEKKCYIFLVKKCYIFLVKTFRKNKAFIRPFIQFEAK